jgi:archaemetzincin
MRVRRRELLVGGTAAVLGGCAGASDAPEEPARRGVAAEARRRASAASPPFAPARLREVRARLVPLAERTAPSRPGEWLHHHPEPGQTFEEYTRSRPTPPTPERRELVVQPLGETSPERARILELVTRYLTLHFGLPARQAPALSWGAIPRGARRRPPGGTPQILSGWILRDVLAPRLPRDAAALLGFTETDLWPGDGWNYVFGEASLEERVGVWSLHRYGDPEASPRAFRMTLLRALKVAVHETGHMFSLPHCTAYKCVQAGINSLEEEDRSPLALCPECLAKVSWITSTDPRDRLRGPRDFCREVGLASEADGFDRALSALGAG